MWSWRRFNNTLAGGRKRKQNSGELDTMKETWLIIVTEHNSVCEDRNYRCKSI